MRIKICFYVAANCDKHIYLISLSYVLFIFFFEVSLFSTLMSTIFSLGSELVDLAIYLSDSACHKRGISSTVGDRRRPPQSTRQRSPQKRRAQHYRRPLLCAWIGFELQSSPDTDTTGWPHRNLFPSQQLTAAAL